MRSCSRLFLHTIVGVALVILAWARKITANDELADSNKNDSLGLDAEDGESHGVRVASIRFDYVGEPLTFTLYMIAVVLAKILYHRLKWLNENVPESCLLIFVGFLIGIGFFFTKTHHDVEFDIKEFFLFLLPPIILEASYSLRDRAFMDNIGSILLYAVFGTILNIVLISVLLYGCKELGAMGALNVDILDILIFGALIAAVDPVAVLAIFQEVGVNERLYFMVFGESLLNDAVTVVVYNLVIGFKTTANISYQHILLSLAAFLVTSVAAMLIGVLSGLFSSYILKFTETVRVVEPIVMFGVAFLSYYYAELFHFSGIISIICCGVIQCHYAMDNISSKSYITIHYSAKVLSVQLQEGSKINEEYHFIKLIKARSHTQEIKDSTMAESFIFISLGVMLLNARNFWESWNTGFCLLSLLFCIFVRFVVVFALTCIVNSYSVDIRKVTIQEQLIMSYGGLRGAISFSLVAMLSQTICPAKDTLMSATFLIILFTVFLQGITIKPIVHLLRIKLRAAEVTMNKEIAIGVVDNLMTGTEAIVGYKGAYYWTTLIRNISHNYIRPVVQRNAASRGKHLVVTQTELSMVNWLAEHHSQVSEGSAIWKELESIDRSVLPAGCGAVMLDAQDSQREKCLKKNNNRKAKLNLDDPADILYLHDALSTPLHKTLHYDSVDRNITSDSERYKRLQHLSKARKMTATVKRTQTGLLEAAVIPMFAGLALGAKTQESELSVNTSLLPSSDDVSPKQNKGKKVNFV